MASSIKLNIHALIRLRKLKNWQVSVFLFWLTQRDATPWDFSAFMMGAEQILSLSTGGLKEMNCTIMSIRLLIISLLVILNKDLTDYYIIYPNYSKRLRE